MIFLRSSLARIVLVAASICVSADLSMLMPQAFEKKEQKSPAFLIDDSVFVLSPGDRIHLEWWGTGAGDEILTVDSHGELLVPEVGKLDVRGRPFLGVREELEKLVRDRYHPRLLSVRVVEVQPATVWISGMVPNPGPQTIEAGTRLSGALTLCGISVNDLMRAGMTSYPARSDELTWAPSLRRTLVVRGGDTIECDLTKAFRAGDSKQDPYLYSGDVVLVPPMGAACGIRGPRSAPSVQEVRPGESIASFLDAAGIRKAPDRVRVTSRGGRDGELSSNETLPEDAILLACLPDTQATRLGLVFVAGQVPHPGPYPLRAGMTIGDAFALAGGSTGSGDSLLVFGVQRLGAAVLPARRPGIERETNIPELAQARLAYASYTRGQYAEDDIVLQPLDSVIVHRVEAVVWVGGRVRKPGFVPWRKGAGWKDYIEAAGGVSSRAWKSRTILFDPVTEQSSELTGEIRPGSALLVPESRYIPPEQWLTIGVNIVSIMASLVTIYFLMESSK